ncbi:MAG TPA: bifunctional riboflavin kinase/FAD synthetase [Acidimicrobiales bacterium]|nr:bifunctional riboflavin kinase/FAD synthetase [Acidimicrobiales bacterium]
MKVVRDTEGCVAPMQGSAVTIGAYDGVHLGHQQVIRAVRDLEDTDGLASAVVTFDRHPASVVRPESAPMLLSDLDQKLEYLDATGIDIVVVITFDEARSEESAEDFVRSVLVDCLRARKVIVGEDFHFGHERKGNVDLLIELGAIHGFTVEGMDLVGVDGQAAAAADRVSSTAIRRALAEGDLASANRLLGRPHEVRGIVAHGDKRGRELGFPTANVSVPGDIMLPADGIYAGWFERPDGTVLRTAMSLGRRPTFYEEAHASLLECFILDFEGDLYDESVRVRFVERLRGEQKFDGIEPLIEQMQRDVERAREILARPGGTV